MTYLKTRMFQFLFFIITLILISCDQKIIDKTEWKLVGSGFKFPEGPAWDSKGTLYVSNCYGNWLTKIESGKLDTLVLSSDSTIMQTNGLIVSSDGDIYACDFGFGSILRITPSGEVNTLISGYKGEPFNRPNDIVITRNGNFYFSDPKSYGKDKLDGRLFYYDFNTESVKLVADSLAFPNGIGISPIDEKLYLSESAKNHILSFEITDNGEVIKKEIFVELPGGDPDGIEFDIEGNLYVAHFGTGTLFVISPNGEILEKIKTPGKKPSNIEFGDHDLRTIYLTEDETNSVYKLRGNIPGYKLH